jgi:hypothetical protein
MLFDQSTGLIDAGRLDCPHARFRDNAEDTMDNDLYFNLLALFAQTH